MILEAKCYNELYKQAVQVGGSWERVMKRQILAIDLITLLIHFLTPNHIYLLGNFLVKISMVRIILKPDFNI